VLRIRSLGTVPYHEAASLQHALAERAEDDYLLLLQHPHVYTLGAHADDRHVLVDPAEVGATLERTDRGGDVTYHGPGQLVGYPILDLTQHRRDISWYMRSLEEVFIHTARDFGIAAERSPGAAGVWVGNYKLVAMGVHLSRWVTSHGFALNVNTDLRYFEWIVPCGLHGKEVTSLAKLLGRPVGMDEVTERVVEHFGEVFGVEVAESLKSKV
jgi:lipoyl(octanoyl) transferase